MVVEINFITRRCVRKDGSTCCLARVLMVSNAKFVITNVLKN
jgi:hypothetical protein